jgi:peptide/nickel transport system permease protein
MFSYLIRRLLYTVPIIFGVMVITFILFFAIQEPETMARVQLGKRATPQSVQAWLHNRGYDKPRFLNLPSDRGHKVTITEKKDGRTRTVTYEDSGEQKGGGSVFDSIFFHQMWRFATFDFGKSDVTGRPLSEVFKAGAIPSLLITVPAFFVGLATAVAFALLLVFFRHSPIDTSGTILCVMLMSLPSMIYIIFGQAVVAIGLKYFPAFGYELNGLSTMKFLLLPVALMVVLGLGSDTRLYRTIFLEEYGQDYVRTAFAKGVPISRVMWVHVLKNGMIALITLTVAHLPVLILGSLLMENFFGIPGLGNTLYLAIQTTDFATVQAFVFIGALLIQGGLIATDFCYALVDPRIRLS